MTSSLRFSLRFFAAVIVGAAMVAAGADGPGPATAPADPALASLRRSVEALDDASEAVQRYERFMTQIRGTPLEAEAQRDLAMWRDRADRRMVRIGHRWVTLAERSALREAAIALIGSAIEQLDKGALREVEQTLREALAADEANPAAWYLRGLLEYQRGRTPEARKAFERADALSPRHGPTLNNLAVTMWRQNQHVAALAQLDAAMAASPLDRAVLDNVAEAVYAMAERNAQGDRAPSRAPPVQRALKHFAEQDAELAAEMSKRGLYRWGAGWVDQAERDRLRSAEAQVQGKLDALDADLRKTQEKIEAINEDVSDNERALRQIEARSYLRDSRGRIRAAARGSVYREIRDDNAALLRERDALHERLDAIRAEADLVRSTAPKPAYSGTLSMIGTEGTPGLEALTPPAMGPTTRGASDQ